MKDNQSNSFCGKDYSLLAVGLKNRVATITINNAPVNALSGKMMKELKQLLSDMSTDSTIRVIVFDSANPDFFIAHVDINILREQEILRELSEAAPEGLNLFQAVGLMLRLPLQVTIVKLRGIARGGGAEFVAAADMSFASLEKGLLAQCEALMGIIPGGGATQFLSSKMPRNRVLEIILGAELFDAATAERYGWINRAVAEDKLDAFVDTLAMNIAALPEGVIEAAKKVLAPSLALNGFRSEDEQWSILVNKPVAGQIMTNAMRDGAQTVAGELGLEKLLRSSYLKLASEV